MSFLLVYGDPMSSCVCEVKRSAGDCCLLRFAASDSRSVGILHKAFLLPDVYSGTHLFRGPAMEQSEPKIRW